MLYSDPRIFLGGLALSLDPSNPGSSPAPEITRERVSVCLENLPSLVEIGVFHVWRQHDSPQSDLCLQSGELLIRALSRLEKMREFSALYGWLPSRMDLFQVFQQLDDAFGTWQWTLRTREYSDRNPERLLHRLKYCRWILEAVFPVVRLLSPPEGRLLGILAYLESELRRPDWYDGLRFYTDNPTGTAHCSLLPATRIDSEPTP